MGPDSFSGLFGSGESIAFFFPWDPGRGKKTPKPHREGVSIGRREVATA